MCLAAIYWARIDAVYYGNTREDAAAIGFDDAAIYEEMGKSIADQNTRKIKLLRLGEEGAREAFHAWTTLQTKTEY
jgi:tRNA(Arg) A34 adenosine deaminase TadA